MRVFDNITIKNNSIFNNSWIEWDHMNIPNDPIWFRDLIRMLMALLNHCLVCTALDGCYFFKNNMPKMPQHSRCDCRTKYITKQTLKNNIEAHCPIEKFTNYIFTDIQKSKGKITIFESLGFNINDSSDLKKEFEKQAELKYLSNQYELGLLDYHGQRIKIEINLKNISFISGWMIKPNGKLINTTPFGGWI